MDLHALLRMFDEIQNDALDLVNSPGPDQRDAFAFGKVHGILLAVGMMREKTNEYIQQQAQDE